MLNDGWLNVMGATEEDIVPFAPYHVVAFIFGIERDYTRRIADGPSIRCGGQLLARISRDLDTTCRTLPIPRY